MSVTACIMVRDNLEPLKRCIPSIKPYVDEILVAVDERTRQPVITYLKKEGVRYYKFTFKDFGSARNQMIEAARTKWIFIIDSDETLLPEHAKMLKEKIAWAEKNGVNGFHVPRRHWYDLEMTNEWKHPYPDRHWRLFTSDCEYRGKVHEQIVGIKKSSQLDPIHIQHFNMYYRSPKDWKRVNQLYDRLKRENRKKK